MSIVKGYYKIYRAFPDPEYFYIENAYNGSNTVTVSKSGTPTATDLQYKVNNGTWTDINLSSSSTNITLSALGDKVYFRGDNPNGFSNGFSNYIKFTANKNHNVGGNISSLLNRYGEDVLTIPNDYCFYNLFNSNLKLVDASALVLPATTLTSNCYSYMFRDCTSLTEAPELPATTLSGGCYGYMFNGCSSLTTAPELPATTLPNSCYYYMFEDCTNLNYIKVGATSWNTIYASSWVNGVSATGTFVKPSATTIPTGTSGIPSGWTVVNE